METRKVTIINSKTQSQKIIKDSKATTLGELKREMSEEGIDYTDMTFYEGHMRAELKDDAAPLPTNIPYKGQIVNDLVFMLTAPDKKIKSGSMSRAKVYAEIKKRNLQNACISKFGKNYTQCSTADLISLIEDNKCTSSITTHNEDTLKESNAPIISDSKCLEALTILVEELYDEDLIREEVYDEVINIINGSLHNKSENEKMSKADIDEMFSFVD